MPSPERAMSSSNRGGCAGSGTARKKAPSISRGMTPSTSRFWTETSSRTGRLSLVNWTVSGYFRMSIPHRARKNLTLCGGSNNDGLKRFQVLDEITPFRFGQGELEHTLVVTHDSRQIREASVVIEAAFCAR